MLAVRSMQESARRSGADRMSLEEINRVNDFFAVVAERLAER